MPLRIFFLLEKKKERSKVKKKENIKQKSTHHGQFRRAPWTTRHPQDQRVRRRRRGAGLEVHEEHVRVVRAVELFFFLFVCCLFDVVEVEVKR